MYQHMFTGRQTNHTDTLNTLLVAFVHNEEYIHTETHTQQANTLLVNKNDSDVYEIIDKAHHISFCILHF